MQRATRIAGSLAIVLVAYWAYALLAVPSIEPSATLRDNEGITKNNRDRASELLYMRLKPLKGLFPQDAWELKNPKILGLDNDRTKLLFQDYRNLGDGRVEIRPCTIIFAHDGPAENEAQRHRQSIVLEAPGGAVLQFDQPLDLSRAKVGRLVAGQLTGPITIRSDWKEPGPRDDLLIVTRDIQLTEQTISTPHPIDFRWGPHFGRGRQMVVKLLSDETRPKTKVSGPNIAGIESFEIRHVERLHLDLAGAASLPDGKSDSVPVEISCCGPFRFDVLRRVATFHDRVDVMKQNASGPPDRIACELLSLYFTERKNLSQPLHGSAAVPAVTSGQDVRAPAGSLDLAAERLEAQGNPVVVTAPSRNLNARGSRIEYNLPAKSIALDGGREVFLQQGPNEIHARSLYYQAADEGRLGRVTAQGPGWLRGQSPDRPQQRLEATWKDQLRVFPHQQNHVISLTGGAELKFQGVGQLQAREIFFWLVETPTVESNVQSRLRPDRMLARNDVRMNSPQLSGKVERLEVWFLEEGREERGERREERVQGSGVQKSQRGMGGSPPIEFAGQPMQAQQRFEVVGRLLRARILLGGPRPGVSHLLLEDDVRFLETQTSQPGDRPLLIRGDRLEVTDAAGPRATVTVTGRPARFEGRGLGLTGTNINLDRGANRLWIDGAGQMDLPFSDGLPGQPAAAPGVLTVDWRRRMEFDGRVARFEDSVVAVGARQRLRTETMEVQLQRPIRFSEPNMQAPPQVEEIRCRGGVSMENRTFDRQQRLISYDRMQVTDLAVNVLGGALTAGGPGWLNSVRRGGADDVMLGGRPAGATDNAAARPAASEDRLRCLHVKFQGSIAGNLLRRRLTFRDQVRTAYAPADDWETMLTTEDPKKLGPGGVVVRCDRLSVVEMLLPVGGRRAVELEALGNTVVESATFTARGHRITYAEAKDLLVLEGDGHSDAELFRQLQVGAHASKVAARKILYWPKTNRFKVDGARSLEIGRLPNGNGTK